MNLAITTAISAALGLVNLCILSIDSDESRMRWGAFLCVVGVLVGRLIWICATRCAQRAATTAIIKGEPTLDIILATIDPIGVHPEML